jgi:hypothetical protein
MLVAFIGGIQACNTVKSCKCIPVFLRNMLPPSSGYDKSVTIENHSENLKLHEFTRQRYST